jgi:TonB family protein
MKILISAFLLLISQWVFSQTSNKALQMQLDSINKTDQLYRGSLIEDTAKKYGWQSARVRLVMNKQAQIDRQNLQKVETIIKQYGYPGKSLAGEQRKSIAFIVIQHNDLDAQEKHLPLLTEAANKGELNWSSLAIMIDRITTGHGKKQIYGSQLHDSDHGTQVQLIDDEINVNKRRKQVGLMPLQDYLKQYYHITYLPVTVQGNKNPASLYYDQTVVNRKESPVEPVHGYPEVYSRLQYPQAAKENHIEGKVTLQFTVDTNGNTTELMVVKGLGYGCDQEALRVIKETRYINKSGEDHELRIALPFPYQKEK